MQHGRPHGGKAGASPLEKANRSKIDIKRLQKGLKLLFLPPLLWKIFLPFPPRKIFCIHPWSRLLCIFMPNVDQAFSGARWLVLWEVRDCNYGRVLKIDLVFVFPAHFPQIAYLLAG